MSKLRILSVIRRPYLIMHTCNTISRNLSRHSLRFHDVFPSDSWNHMYLKHTFSTNIIHFYIYGEGMAMSSARQTLTNTLSGHWAFANPHIFLNILLISSGSIQPLIHNMAQICIIRNPFAHKSKKQWSRACHTQGHSEPTHLALNVVSYIDPDPKSLYHRPSHR